MATDTLQTESAPATPKLATELKELEERARRAEMLLRGAESILTSIRLDSGISYSPADPDDRGAHRRALEMIDFLGEQITEWREAEEPFDFIADDLSSLAERALEGRLVRHERPILEACK